MESTEKTILVYGVGDFNESTYYTVLNTRHTVFEVSSGNFATKKNYIHAADLHRQNLFGYYISS